MTDDSNDDPFEAKRKRSSEKRKTEKATFVLSSGKDPISVQFPSGYEPHTEDTSYRKDVPNENYHIIGEGKYSYVIAAKLDYNHVEGKNSDTNSKPNMMHVTCKRYDLGQLKNTFDGYTRIRRELQICRLHRHENIVDFYEVFTEPAVGSPMFIYVVSERMNHSLAKYYEILTTKKIEEVDVLHLGALLTQILRALSYLHQRGIMHRNVSPMNIGINTGTFTVKLFDFGLAREINVNLDHSTNVETLHYYKAIEGLLREPYDMKIDIWAAALVAIELLGLKLFWPSGTEKDVLELVRRRGAENAIKDRVFEVLGVPTDRYKSIFSRPVFKEPCVSTLEKVLMNETKRKIKDKDQSEITGVNFRDLVTRMLNPDRQKRLSADECLKHPFLKAFNKTYQEKSVSSQPKTDDQFQKRNENDKNMVLKELKAGLTQLSFRPELSMP
ncbi:unnamed protein product, partial [Mesorhabditis belari]|uniref:Protein kinase domain-containing protein n=1 Tax=Mesorhabditis belari TaxID=2138241 RepID=A0AAF3J796_9BILA